MLPYIVADTELICPPHRRVARISTMGDGRNTSDIRDEISMTPQGLPSPRSRRTGRHQLGERYEVLHPKARPPAADAHVGIDRNEIRPIDGHGAQAAVGVLEGHSILSPELLGDDERKRQAPKGMERVGDLNLRRISDAGCNRQLSRRTTWRAARRA
jgi:hypothetical protein